MQIGVIGSSLKSHEKRVPIHPQQIKYLAPELQQSLILEIGYGQNFGVSDQDLAQVVGGFKPRTELLQEMDKLLLLKPQQEDFEQMRKGALHWGWPHCVQQIANTQIAIERQLTFLAFEAMFAWGPQGEPGLHTFYKNNELAGYAAVQHGFNLRGMDGGYGPKRQALILGFGSVSRGAVYALQARGIHEITVIDNRPEFIKREAIPGCRHLSLLPAEESNPLSVQTQAGEVLPLIQFIQQADIIVNGIFQNPSQPLMYMQAGEENQLKADTLILDVSCDEGMGFPFARPTSFKDPIFQVAHAYYYAVDHTPSYLWESASWEVSKALLPFLEAVLKEQWADNETLRRAIEIERGVIKNPAILDFQKRSPNYPHPIQ